MYYFLLALDTDTNTWRHCFGTLEDIRYSICHHHAQRNPYVPISVDWEDQWQAVFRNACPDLVLEERDLTPELLIGLACELFNCTPDEVRLAEANTIDEIAEACSPHADLEPEIMRELVAEHFEHAQALFGRTYDDDKLPWAHLQFTTGATMESTNKPGLLFLEQVRRADAVVDDLKDQLRAAQERLYKAAQHAYDEGISIEELAEAINATPECTRSYLQIVDPEYDEYEWISRLS